jgi:hypothetical protein
VDQYDFSMKIGDWYHRWIYCLLARLTAGVSDSTRFAFSDPLLGGSLFIYELIVLAAIWNPSYGTSDLYVTALVLGLVMLTYGLNFLRAPLKTKMALVIPKTLNQSAEVDYVVKRLNELSPSRELSFEEQNERINSALAEFSKRVDGYQVPHAKRTKISLFSKYLLRRRIGGVMCPFFQEIVVTSKLFPEDIAHEKAHLVGYARECEAQFVGYVVMFNSEDPLKYLAYTHRLDMLIRMFDLSMDELEAKGLNQRTVREFRYKRAFLDEEFAKNSTYRKLLVKLGTGIRSMMLRVFGEGNCKDAYVETPLLMVSAYDPPK